MASSSGLRPSSDGSMSSSSTGSIMKSRRFLQRCSQLHEGAIGLGMAGLGVTLVLCTSRFNRSSWIRKKEIIAIRVRMGILEKGWPVGRLIGLGGSRLRFRADLGGCLVSV
ncbi:hypothetical protein B296_00016070 [Ensete ventricosum]|uniref:Uncharacterized protein n=1 Tax=Ensete ventricosum TaxID=4639 RepID=A0A426XT65_ENSVE|nr:hypothetical protein B296_00016070 [Ensete ventricosum]